MTFIVEKISKFVMSLSLGTSANILVAFLKSSKVAISKSLSPTAFLISSNIFGLRLTKSNTVSLDK